MPSDHYEVLKPRHNIHQPNFPCSSDIKVSKNTPSRNLSEKLHIQRMRLNPLFLSRYKDVELVWETFLSLLKIPYFTDSSEPSRGNSGLSVTMATHVCVVLISKMLDASSALRL
jgi:hypothetical protein